MGQEDIVRQVYAAKKSAVVADGLIGSYLPYIKAETAKFLQRPPIEGRDDELSVAMIAFHEAIAGYSRARGAFLKYASLLIRSRLIDYKRKEARHGAVLSLDMPAGGEGVSAADLLPDGENAQDAFVLRDATRAEIAELSRQMEGFGVSLTDVAENCPRQRRTLGACQKALLYARQNPALLEELLRAKRLPISTLAAGCGVEKKTLERHRKYLVALLLAYTNGYEIIRGHIKQVLKGGTGH